MIEQHTCSECGKVILARTAELTGNLCRPCFNRIRRSAKPDVQPTPVVVPEPLQRYPLRPYETWPEDRNSRWVYAGHTFGIHLIKAARDQALGQIPAGTDEATKRVASKAIRTALGGVAELLDGFFRNEIDSEHRVEYVLQARIVHTDGRELETVELARGGDGLAMGLSGWWLNEFWW
jgi:hypothetical protein